MKKRPSDGESAPAKRRAEHAFIAPELQQWSSDASTFFCLFYRDLLTHLTQFVVRSVPVYISDPLALRCTCTVELCREDMGTAYPTHVWDSVLSAAGLPALLYLGGPTGRCVRLFLNEECTEYADRDIEPWKPPVATADLWRRELFFTDDKVYIVAGYYSRAREPRVRIEAVDLRTGRCVDEADKLVRNDRMSFALSHDATQLFACVDTHLTLSLLLTYDATNLREPALRTRVKRLPGTFISTTSRACRYGHGLLGQYDTRGRDELRITRPSGDSARVIVAAPRIPAGEDASSQIDAQHGVKDQLGRLYMPQITPPNSTDVWVYSVDGALLCRVPIPESVMFMDMRIAAPNTISLLYVDYVDHADHVLFVRCTIP
jgi:hypothetical protein